MNIKLDNNFYGFPVLRTLPFLFFKIPNKDIFYKYENFLFASILTYLGVSILADYVSVQDGHYFINWGIAAFFCKLFFLATFYYLFCENEKKEGSAAFLYTVTIEIWILSSVILLFFYVSLTRLLSFDVSYVYLQGFQFAFQSTTIGFFLYWVLNKNLYTLKIHLLTYCSIVVLPFVFFNFINMPFWMGDFDDEGFEDYFYIENQDQLFDKQTELMDIQTELLAQGIPDKTELYFLGFASYASQSVFRNEVEYIKSLIDSEFSLPNHSINLINSRETMENRPLATGGNIKRAISAIESKMNLNEDILFLYLTSHGSSDHQLSVEFYPLSLANLEPSTLAEYVNESKIRWRVIVISACYSGGFVDALKDDNNIIVTAADATSTSFGCADDRDFTYFGEAVFKNNFSPNKTLIETFEHAIELVSLREKEESLKASNPQLWVGENIKEYLSNRPI